MDRPPILHIAYYSIFAFPMLIGIAFFGSTNAIDIARASFTRQSPETAAPR